jgi:hypothetical protein
MGSPTSGTSRIQICTQVSTSTLLQQPTMIDLVDIPGQPVIKTRSARLILGVIRTMRHKESIWSSVVIGKRSIPPSSTQ